MNFQLVKPEAANYLITELMNVIEIFSTSLNAIEDLR